MSVVKRFVETMGERAAREHFGKFARGTLTDGQTGLTMTGDKALDQYLETLPTRVAKQGMRTATRKVAHFVRKIAIDMVPEKTGALASSIKVRAGKRRKGLPWLVTTSVRTGTGGNMFVGDQYYGGFLEFGTAERRHKSGKSTGRIERSRWAFLLPALFAFIETKRRMFSDELAAWVRRQAGAAK